MDYLADAVAERDPGVWLLFVGSARPLLLATRRWPAVRAALNLPQPLLSRGGFLDAEDALTFARRIRDHLGAPANAPAASVLSRPAARSRRRSAQPSRHYGLRWSRGTPGYQLIPATFEITDGAPSPSSSSGE